MVHNAKREEVSRLGKSFLSLSSLRDGISEEQRHTHPQAAYNSQGGGHECFSLAFIGHPHAPTHSTWRASAGSDGASGWRCRCRRIISCCGMCDALFHRSDEQDETSGPLLQSSEEDPSVRNHSHAPLAGTRHVSTVSSSLRHEKVGSTLLQTQIAETQYRSSSGSGQSAIEKSRVKEHERDQKPNVSQLPLPSKSGKSEAVTSLLDDEDICPTCLDGYDDENPKIPTKCGHHFHLACILEWMERSSHCPICDKEMVIIETS
ncbi:hypothetical protein GOP47_0001314 [Adiantum capillus-veneris]|uniref:RING-type E3 ubiquitin transferase n=1 Tax=Adiantum capillus-veneris TaxID=13818 RepID=A0A9D4V808_ADICA|nr:hypothetical protein GOP47_0001314 [Adiantum capillus-veneris]